MKTLLVSLALVIAPLTAQAGGFTLACGQVDLGRVLLVRDTKISWDGTTLHYEVDRGDRHPPQIVDNTPQEYRRKAHTSNAGATAYSFLMGSQVDGTREYTTILVNILGGKSDWIQEIQSDTDADGFVLSARIATYKDCKFTVR